MLFIVPESVVDNQIISNTSVKVNGIVVLFCGVLFGSFLCQFIEFFILFYFIFLFLFFKFAVMCCLMSLPTVYGKYQCSMLATFLSNEEDLVLRQILFPDWYILI
jgi:hypothetical protein